METHPYGVASHLHSLPKRSPGWLVAGLVLSKEVIIQGQYKLIVAQNFGWPPVNDWWDQNGTKIPADTLPIPICGVPDSRPSNASLLGGIPGQRPCLFDIRADVGERYCAHLKCR